MDTEERVVVFTALADMITEGVRVLEWCKRRDSAEGERVKADRPSLIPGAIYQSRGGTLPWCDWLLSSTGGEQAVRGGRGEHDREENCLM